MKNFLFEKNYPSLSYIANNWPRTKPILKKFVMSNHKKPNFYKLCINLLKDMNVNKIGKYQLILKKLSRICSLNKTSNTYHDQHHFKVVIILACLLAKLTGIQNSDKLFLIIIALSHDIGHQGRRILRTPYYQEIKSFNSLKYILANVVFKNKDLNRIKRIFKSTFFLEKPKNVNDYLEKIILDADVLASLMFGIEAGIEFAKRLKHEIRFENDSKILFQGFLKLISEKSLYLETSKKSC